MARPVRDDVHGPLDTLSLDTIEWLAKEPGHHHLHRYGWRNLVLELIRRVRHLEKSK